MVLNMADLFKTGKSLQTLWNSSSTVLKWFLTLWIREGRKLAVFEQKPWAIAHSFESGGFGQVLEIAPNSLKCLLNPSKMISNSLRDCLCRFRENSRGSKFGRFWAKSLGIAHGFENGGFGQVLEIAQNSLKCLLNPSKRISNSLRDCLYRFRENSRGSKIERFWAKTLGYSPWFWKWRIWASPGNRSKLSEMPPKPF